MKEVLKRFFSFVHHLKFVLILLMVGLFFCAGEVYGDEEGKSEKDETKQCKPDESLVNCLPIGKQFVIDQGFGDSLPLPIGVSWNIMWMKDSLKMETDANGEQRISLYVTKKDPLEPMAGPITENQGTITKSIYMETLTSNIKLDVWLLPFLNVFGIIGYIEGDSGFVGASYDKRYPDDPDGLSPEDLLDQGEGMGVNLASLNFDIQLSGVTYGIGGILAGGYPINWGLAREVFVAMDYSVSKSDLDVADSTIETTMMGIRTGVNGTIYGVNGSLHVGLTKLETTTHMVGWVNYGGLEVEYDMYEEPVDPVNYVCGVRWDATKRTKATLEGGIGERRHVLLSIEYRF